MTSQMVKVYVVDDDSAVLSSVTNYLSSQGYKARGFSTASSLIEFLDWSDGVDCVILDVKLPDKSGIDLLSELQTRIPEAPVIVISGLNDIAMAVSAMSRGATTFLAKPIDPVALSGALRAALERKSSRNDLLEKGQAACRIINTLPQKQKEVLALVMQGYTSKEIGTQLNLSYRTVEAHRNSVMQNLNARNIAEMIKIATLAKVAETVSAGHI